MRARIKPTAGALLALCAATAAHAQNPFAALNTYSATIEMTGTMTGAPSPGAQGRGNLKIYRSGDRIRTDLPGGSSYSVVDMSQHVSYMVMGNGLCMQMASQQEETPLAHSPDATIERAPVGTESVDGHVCKVENLTITPHSGPRAGQPTTAKVWEAEDLHGFPIKIEMQTARGLVSMHYKDIDLREPDAALFAHPDNCRSLQGMPGMPGMSPGPH